MYPKELIRYISGDYSPKDEEFVRNWLSEDPTREQVLEELRRVWKLLGQLDIGDEDQAWIELKHKTLDSKREYYNRRDIVAKQLGRRSHSALNIFLKVAAVLMIVAGAYGFYMYSISSDAISQEDEQIAYNSVSSNGGERVRFRIKDGTKVVLNASSKIRYGENYGTSSRRIYLEGEAYFEVNHDHPFPFVVYTNGARVEDIGTKFNVKAYRDQQATEIVVSEGKVRVSPKAKEDESGKGNQGGNSVLLSQGQKVNVRDDAPDQLNIQRADLNKALSWLQDQLIFDAEPLSDIIGRLESYYDIKVKVVDSTLLNKRISASFDNESLENILKVLAISMEADYSFEGDTVKFINESRTPNSN